MPAPTPCYHCGLPVPAGSQFRADVLGQSREMCCPGCQAVAEAIVAGGLEHYYSHRSENSANPCHRRYLMNWHCMTAAMCSVLSCSTRAN